MAVDAAGDVYVVDNRSSRVLKLPAGSNTQSELPFTDLDEPAGVAVDTVGNIYVTDIGGGDGLVLKLPAGSNTQSKPSFIGPNLQPEGVAVDPARNVYVTDMLKNRVLKLPAQ
ncbi:MAG: hypothetical protein QOJ56_4985 [Mycobacterium sp.]|nr:hypothetical protein [Mycobacterium sp.]MDT5322514.1 hypothetical protein [Mycobacterium sp.]MDT5356453.1 hypothetical protein [Mycobacterium sp.]MDT7721128.1 hypothetical protein [Mycobacterium sp.]